MNNEAHEVCSTAQCIKSVSAEGGVPE